MRRILLALPLVLLAGGALAQSAPEPVVLQLDFDHVEAVATLGAAKGRFAAVAGVLQYDAAKPANSMVSLSLDTTSLDAVSAKAVFDSENHPELRIASTGPATGSGESLSLPVIVTVGEVTKPGTFHISYKPGTGGTVNVHVEGSVSGADFPLKGHAGSIPLSIDAPFVRMAR